MSIQNIRLILVCDIEYCPNCVANIGSLNVKQVRLSMFDNAHGHISYYFKIDKIEVLTSLSSASAL